MESLFSSPAQLARLTQILTRYMTLPFFDDKIPGAVMEAALSSVCGGEVLRTYDFVDVVNRKNRVGWQVKSTQFATPLTWKRAKIPDALALDRRFPLVAGRFAGFRRRDFRVLQ